MKIIKSAILVLLIVLIMMQFFRPPGNYPTTTYPNDIAVIYKVPENTDIILQNTCRDCHSNYTRFRKYNNTQPFAWWLNSKVQSGKRSLNFSEFGAYPISKQYRLLQDMVDEVKKDEMPLGFYSLIHSKGKLSNEDKNTLYKWAAAVRDTIKAKYPADSLLVKE